MVEAAAMSEVRNSNRTYEWREIMTDNAILVGLDGSEQAAAALRWAANQSAETGRPLSALHVYDSGARVHLRTGAVRNAIESDARARATRWMSLALGSTRVGSTVGLEVAEGSPAKVLAYRSRFASLLVLGAPGTPGIRRVLGGSVSRFCSHHAACPLVLVPGTESSPGHAEEGSDASHVIDAKVTAEPADSRS